MFLTIFAWWWKDPDPYLWLTEPETEDQKLTDPPGPPDLERLFANIQWRLYRIFVNSRPAPLCWHPMQRNCVSFSSDQDWISTIRAFLTKRYNIYEVGPRIRSVLWIRIDPDLYWDADPDSGVWKLTTVKKWTCFPAFLKGFCTFVNRGYVFWPITYFKYIFHVKIQLFWQ